MTSNVDDQSHNEAWVQRFREARQPQDGSGWSDELADGVLAALTSPAGKRVLWQMITDTATVPSMRFDGRQQRHVDQVVSANGEELRKHLQSIVDLVSQQLKEVGEPAEGASQDDPAEKTIGEMKLLLKGLGGGGVLGIPGQAIEALDDLKLWSPEMLMQRLPAGLIAAAAAFLISAAANSDRYRRGKVRWDDAVDATATDTVKAGLTGVVVSSIAAALMPTLSPPVALAVVALLSPLVYSVVGQVVDFAYLKLLGGDAIMDARSLHLDYLIDAAFMRQELWPRIRQMHQAGQLVDRLDALGKLNDEASKPVRQKMLAAARTNLANFVNTSQPSALAQTFTSAYEDRVLSYYAVKTGVAVPSEPQAFVSYAEVAELERLVHETYWERWAASSGYRKIAPSEVVKMVAAAWQFDALPKQKSAFLRKVVEHCCAAEQARGTPEAPLRYLSDWKDSKKNSERYALHATSPSEFVQIVLALEQSSNWPWSPSLGHKPQLLEDWFVKPLTGMEALTVSDPSVVDAVTGYRELNRFYSKDLYEGLRTGRYRLFGYGSGRGGAAPAYIAAPATEQPPTTQAQHISALLRRHHPKFKGAGADALVQHLEPIDVSAKSNADNDYQFMLNCLGLRVLVLDGYTATFRISKPDLNGTMVVSTEGYFASFTEACSAFKTLPNADLAGVRPGPKVLSDLLRERARQWDPKTSGRDQVFVLQNELLGRLGEGLILLDQLANKTEATVASLAGAGVFLSWWWSFTGRSRRELLGVLKELHVQQALRAEIMAALLEVQRIHVLSHSFFDDMAYSGVAKAGEEDDVAATKALSSM